MGEWISQIIQRRGSLVLDKPAQVTLRHSDTCMRHPPPHSTLPGMRGSRPLLNYHIWSIGILVVSARKLQFSSGHLSPANGMPFSGLHLSITSFHMLTCCQFHIFHMTLSQAHTFQKSFHKLKLSNIVSHLPLDPFTGSSFSAIISQAHIFHKTISHDHTFQKSFHKLKLISNHFTSSHLP